MPGQPPVGRTRAPKACQRCRQRRERCDGAVRGTPCTRCESRNITDCVMVPTKRGRYAPPSGGYRPVEGHVHLPMVDADILDRLSPEQRPDGSSKSPQLTSADSLGNFSNTSAASAVSSYQELSWTQLFQYLVDNHSDDQRELVDKCSITYHGETFPFTMVLGNLVEGSSRSILHHAGPKAPEPNGTMQENDCDPTSSLSAADMEWLKAKGAFKGPSQQLLDALVVAFVDRFYPLYPVVHLDETLRQLKARTLPWILLHAICFVAAGVCPAEVLHQAGYSRRGIREHFYAKTKALFDSNYEINQLVLLQTTTLMSFFMGRPYEYWNFWSWHASSVTMAESMGLHRSIASSNIPPRDKSLLRRIWWVIVIRDASTNSMLGRPFRVNFQQCDMESLTMADFEFDINGHALKNHSLRDAFGLYQIHMAALAGMLQRIVLSRYGPGGSEDNIKHLNDELIAWHGRLPPELKTHEGPVGEILGRALSMVYQHHLILTNLRSPHTTASFPAPPEQLGKEVIDKAAQTLLSHACQVVRSSSTLRMPHESFAPLFVAQVVFLKRARCPDQGVAGVARAALTTCQLLWHTISESWDSGPWVMDLFDKMTALVDRVLENERFGGSPGVVNMANSGSVDLMGVDPTVGGLSGCLDVPFENGAGFGEFPGWMFPSTSSNQTPWGDPFQTLQ